MSPANEDLWPLRAITSVSPGPHTVMTATCTLREEPLVENSVCLAPTASANSSCAVDCTCHARSRVSSPWLIGRAAPGGAMAGPAGELRHDAASTLVRGDCERHHAAIPERRDGICDRRAVLRRADRAVGSL